MVVQSQADLPQVVFAGHATGCFPHFLNCGEEEANQ
jgi:hypothetical protein